jgi:glycosyltransferase involved in cell wall biosynthesis
MKILLVNKFHYLRGGAERAYFDTASILTERGHSVAFFSMDHPLNQPTPWSKFFVSGVEYGADGNMSLVQKLHAACRIIWNAEAYRKMLAIIDEFHPDVAHLHNIYHQLSPSILWALKKRRIPIVMTLHDYKLVSPNYSLFVRGKIWGHTSGWRCLFDRCVKDSFLKSFICVIEKWLHDSIGSYGCVDMFIAPSHFLADTFHEFGFSHEIRFVPQPVLLRSDMDDEEATNIGGDTHLYLGRLSVEKDVETLLRAFVMLPLEESIDIVGDGPDRMRLESLAKELGLSSRVHFLGTKSGEELLEKIKRSKSIIIPSAWYENMPYVLLEALSFGKIVIAARIGGMSERITDGENGFLFEPGDARSLAEKISLLKEIDKERMVSYAKKSVSDISKEQYGETLEALYEALITH